VIHIAAVRSDVRQKVFDRPVHGRCRIIW
jgi:hypothetical protein